METILLFIACFILMAIGLIGVILPFLPGLPLAWIGLFVFAILTNFEKISLVIVLIFLGITALISILDFVAPLLGAKKYKASKEGMIGAFLGSLLGIFIFGFPGVIFGPLAGAAIGEVLAKKSSEQVVQSVLGVFLGVLVGSLVKIVLILIMVGFLIASLF